MDAAKSAQDLTIIGILMLVIAGLIFWLVVGGIRQWWVWGWRYSEVITERNEWKTMALRNFNLVERTTETVVNRP